MLVSNVTSGREGPWIRLGACLIARAAILQAIAVPTIVVGAVVASGAAMGIGFGLSTSLTNRLLLRHLLGEDQAIGSAALLTMRQVGGAAGAALAGVAANLVGFDAGLADATARGAASHVFCAAIPLALLGAASAAMMTRRR